MMATPGYPPQPGMGPGHPGMAHGHPMQMQHGGHMGQPNPAMMGGMHPAMSGPQVTQGMATGVPQNPGTPAPMQNAMAMAHLQGQNPGFQGQHTLGQMQQMNAMNANLIARQRQLNMMHGNPNHPAMMNMQGMGGMNPTQLQQMKMNMPMQQMSHLTPQQQHAAQQQQTYLHQQRMMAQHAQQQQILSHQRAQAQQQQQQQQAQQQAAQQQQQASQQMQMSRSQEPVTQPPQPQPTPAPQAQPTPQSQPAQNPQPLQQTPQQKQQQAQPPTSQAQQSNAPTPQIKQNDDDEAQAKADFASKQQILIEESMAAQAQQFSGQCILQLMSYYDSLACPQRPYDIEYWQEATAKYFSPSGQLRQQLFNNKNQSDKSFLLRYASIARFFHAHFTYGIRRIYMQSFEHSQETLPHGGFHVWSKRLFVTYEYDDGVRITKHGALSVNFDDMQKIEFMHVAIRGWTEYIPRAILEPTSPEQTRQSPKLSKKNLPKNQNRVQLKRSPVLDWGIPYHLMQFLEIAEVMTAMDPLLEYFCMHPVSGPREALNRYNAEMAQGMQARMQNANAAMANGQVPFPNQRMAGMNMPNHFQSPALAHLNLPNNQSPHMNHTPSPGHPGQGGVQMVHQMSAQGSNLSAGSQGPSTNTSPNVSNKRRRASNIKEEDTAVAAASASEKTKPSPRVGKRQKGAAP